jgi:hypothetical protein
MADQNRGIFIIELRVRARRYELSCPDIAAFCAIATKNVEQRDILHSEAEHAKQRYIFGLEKWN